MKGLGSKNDQRQVDFTNNFTLVFTRASKHLHGPRKCQKFGCVSDLHIYRIYTLYTQLLTLTHTTLVMTSNELYIS